MQEMNKLEKTAKMLFQTNGKAPEDKDMDSLYWLQALLIHSSEPELRKRAVEVFNSLSEPYRKFAFPNYDYAKTVTPNKETYTLQLADN